MNPDPFPLLVEATLAGSAAIVLVLALRRPLRAAFGAGAVYAAWGLVPAALLAIALPAAVVPVAAGPMAIDVPDAVAIPALTQAAAFDPRPLLLGLWLLGAVVAAARMRGQQRRFVDGLGTLRARPDGMLQSDAVAGLPAVIGWRARIVLPRDFEQRYDADQQQLVLCHERMHRHRGDLPLNALVSLLRCLSWFNPLVHVAARRFRHDQELACDAAVLRRFPGRRRAYGDALVKTQLADHPLPVACHWFAHPLKERIVMLKRPLPSRSRWLAGFAVVAMLTVAGGWTAWAAQPARSASVAAPAEGELALAMKVSLDGRGEFVETLNLRAGQAQTFEYDQDGQAWAIVLTITPLDDGTLYADADITRDGISQGKPKLVFKPGENGAAIRIGQEDSSGDFKGIAIELSVALPTGDEVTLVGREVSARDAQGAPAVVPKRVARARPAAAQLQPWQFTMSRWSAAPGPELGC